MAWFLDFENCPQCSNQAPLTVDTRALTCELSCLVCGYYHRVKAKVRRFVEGIPEVDDVTLEEKRDGLGGLSYVATGTGVRHHSSVEGLQGNVDFVALATKLEKMFTRGKISSYRLTRWNPDARKVEIIAEAGDQGASIKSQPTADAAP